MTQNQTQGPGNGRSRAALRLLAIGAAAALLALLWTAAGASAARPTVTAKYGGWTANASNAIKAEVAAAAPSRMTMQDRSELTGDAITWNCSNHRCQYLNVEWSNIVPNRTGAPYTITLTRQRPPTAKQIGGPVPATYAVQVSLPVSNTAQQYVPVPWAGERVNVTVKGAPQAAGATRFRVKIPAAKPHPAYSSRAATGAAALARVPGNDVTPVALFVWPKNGATYHEVQYTLRTRSTVEAQQLTKVKETVRGSDLSQGLYSSFTVNWSQHPNASVLSGLTDADFESSGDWLFVAIPLTALVDSQPGWTETIETQLVQALGEDRNTVGIRVRPVLVCAADTGNELCAVGSDQTGVHAVRGKLGRIYTVRFEGDTLQEWLDSAGSAR